MNISFDYALLGKMDTGLDDINLRIATAKLFDRAYSTAKRNRLLAKIFRKDIHLQALSSQPLGSDHHRNHIVSVPIQQIKGSLGRSEDFDVDFNPLNERSRSRWISIATAVRKGTPMPAIELIQVGNTYYVRDGHHRISVARSMDQEAIDAHIVN